MKYEQGLQYALFEDDFTPSSQELIERYTNYIYERSIKVQEEASPAKKFWGGLLVIFLIGLPILLLLLIKFGKIQFSQVVDGGSAIIAMLCVIAVVALIPISIGFATLISSIKEKNADYQPVDATCEGIAYYTYRKSTGHHKGIRVVVHPVYRYRFEGQEYVSIETFKSFINYKDLPLKGQQTRIAVDANKPNNIRFLRENGEVHKGIGIKGAVVIFILMLLIGGGIISLSASVIKDGGGLPSTPNKTEDGRLIIDADYVTENFMSGEEDWRIIMREITSVEINAENNVEVRFEPEEGYYGGLLMSEQEYNQMQEVIRVGEEVYYVEASSGFVFSQNDYLYEGELND